MPKVSEEYMKNRREQIVSATRSLFTERGYQQASMSEIIAASGLSAGAIYNYFSGKTELMAEVARFDAGRFEPVPGELPWEFVERCLVVLAEDAELTRFLAVTWGEAVTVPEVAEVVAGQLQELQARVTASYRVWAEAELDFTEGEMEGWLAVIAAAVMSVLTGFVVQSSTLPAFDVESYLEFARTILRQG